MKLLNSPAFNRLEGAISASEMRHRVLSNNVANDDTPNFRRSEVLFESLLEGQLGTGTPMLTGRKTDVRHMSIGRPLSVPSAQVTTDKHTIMNNDGGNVDIDREMALLARNQLNYNLYVQQLNHDVRMVRTAIDGRV
ncbi:flagellar basal body rod protein FlgB [Paenibacillus sp. GCM10027626]|uniref:flagellar basal body rod protein FlgB n=1 Tax=Paenibacillus sp. GCM10027626 TaxID=3273411 RepID=UPI0036423466